MKDYIKNELMIHKKPFSIGHLKEEAEIVYTDKLGIEYINENDIEWKN